MRWDIVGSFAAVHFFMHTVAEGKLKKWSLDQSPAAFAARQINAPSACCGAIDSIRSILRPAHKQGRKCMLGGAYYSRLIY